MILFQEKYIKDMFVDPAVAPYVVKAEIIEKILDGYKPGNKPNYNIVVE